MLAAASWWVWMGWDTTLLVIGVLAARVLPLWILVPALVVPFVGSWTVTAMTTPDSALWLVGLTFLGFGMTVTTVVLGALARSVWTALDTRGPRRM